MSITRDTTNRNSTNPARRAFAGSQAHPYIIQKHFQLSDRFVRVSDDHFASVIENGRKTPVSIELHPKGIKVTINHKTSQAFSQAALAESDRILAYLGLSDDDNRVFERMCQAFAESHQIDATGATQRVAEERKAAADLAGFDEWFERNEQRRHQPDADPRDHYSDSGHDLNELAPAPATNGHAPQTVAEQITAARASLGGALKSQQPRNSVGSLPTQWQYRR